MNVLCITLVVVTLIFICISDYKYRTVPNRLVLILLVTVSVFCMINHRYGPLFNIVPILFFGGMLWAMRIWGAGDAKLLTALSPLVEHDYLLLVIITMLLLGAVQALLIYLIEIATKKKKTRTVAYAIPISISCMFSFLLSFTGL